MAEVSLELADSKIWEQPELAQKLGQERAALETVVLTIERLEQGLDELNEILTLAVEEQDQDLFAEAGSDLEVYLAD
ncbi:MAG: PCRF domain-containing protein, partial [Pseudomonadales bacterium]